MNQPIYNRFDPAQDYDRHLFRPDRVLQSAELNELQSAAQHRLARVADVIFKDGAIMRRADISVDPATGATFCEDGDIYIMGAVRGVDAAQLSIPVVGYVTIGVYLRRQVIDELLDPALLNPAHGTRGHMEPGALRERVWLAWGVAGDGQPGEFYPVWDVEDGIVRPKEPPPAMDAVTQAITRYDRDSSGGSYIVRGLSLIMQDDAAGGEQVYTLTQGAARVGGVPVATGADKRLVYPATPDLFWVDSEPHMSATEGVQRIQYDRWPVVGEPTVRVHSRKSVVIVHGSFSGAADPLPDNGVVEIETVTQGGTTYVQGADWQLVAGQLDWSPSGAEPNPGSSYSVTYKYARVAEIIDADPRGCSVSGALEGTLMYVSYNHALRRIDLLALNADAQTQWVRGVSDAWTPIMPRAPQGLLTLAAVEQTWDSRRRLLAAGARMVPMQVLDDYQAHLNELRMSMAELRLAVAIAGRYSGLKKGQFADPFLGNDQRDAGIEQSAEIFDGALQLPLLVSTHTLGVGITARQAPPHGHRVIISQPAQTGSMKVNPYQAFNPLWADVTLDPAVDRWEEQTTRWAPPSQRDVWTGTSRTTTELVSETITDLTHLRPIQVGFTVRFFSADEALHSVTFDGIPVIPQPSSGGSLTANAAGTLSGSFQVPAGIPAGTKVVIFQGNNGSRGQATFTGAGRAIERVERQVALVRRYHVDVDPLSQTMSIMQRTQCSGVDLTFTHIGSSPLVELREADGGFPTGATLASVRVPMANVLTDGQPTRVTWSPVMLEPDREYAVVVMADDATSALAVAQLGKFDIGGNRWVTSQPYTVGVLLSSSNNSTWTAHQDQDLKFALLAPDYTSTERLIDLGITEVDDATELLVQAFAERPSLGATCTFVLTMGATTHEVQAGQPLMLPTRYSGPVQVSARLRVADGMGALLNPGVLLLAGSLQTEGDYVSLLINADAAEASTLRVQFEAAIPAGATVTVSAQTAGSSSWEPVPYVTSSPATAGVMSLEYALAGITASGVRLRLELTGEYNARPRVNNLRAVVL